MGPINVVFDINGSLSCTSARNVQYASFYSRKGMILTAIKTHYIFPGVKELLQLLFFTNNVRVSFFSSGAEERNVEFVKELLVRSLGIDVYEKVKSKITILSRNNMVQNIEKYSQPQNREFKNFHGNKKKDVSKVLREGDKLKNTVLIEDDHSYVLHGQEKNLLRVRESDNDTFSYLCSRHNKSYDEKGYTERRCIVIPDKENHREVFLSNKRIEGKHIQLFQKEEGFELRFLDRESNQYVQKTISEDDHPELIQSLNTVCEEGKTFQRSIWFKVEDSELQKKITEVVASHGGRAKKICRKINRIFYLTGLLFKAMEAAKENGKPITDFLFDWQFELDEESEKYEGQFSKMHRRDDIYEYGLEKLKEVNKEIEFNTPHSYKKCIELPLSEVEEKFLKEALENEERGCIIM